MVIHTPIHMLSLNKDLYVIPNFYIFSVWQLAAIHPLLFILYWNTTERKLLGLVWTQDGCLFQMLGVYTLNCLNVDGELFLFFVVYIGHGGVYIVYVDRLCFK